MFQSVFSGEIIEFKEVNRKYRDPLKSSLQKPVFIAKQYF